MQKISTYQDKADFFEVLASDSSKIFINLIDGREHNVAL